MIFFLWLGYRLIGGFPEWVEEIFLKGLIFGVPVIWEINRRAIRQSEVGLENRDFWFGMYMGLALGGLYLSVGYISNVLQGKQFLTVQAFLATEFWLKFFLALFTSWWESLLFWGYAWNTLNHLFAKDKQMAGLNASLWSAILFIVFHLPLIFITFGFGRVSTFGVLSIALFAVGQAFIYWKTKNLYAMTLSQTLWGMMLLVYS